MARNCSSCRVSPGEDHKLGCDVARCKHCGEQRKYCACPAAPSIWTGEWHGVAECRELGWYFLRETGQPCTADTPGALEDLNRYCLFELAQRGLKAIFSAPAGSPDQAAARELLLSVLPK